MGFHDKSEILSGSWREVAERLNLFKIMSCSVNRASSPGVPYCSMASTNGKLIDDFGDFVAETVVERLRLIVRTPLSEVESMSAEELIQGGFCDPMKVFVKNEPHKISKIHQGRYRLISGVSCVDSLIERLLYRMQNSREIREWETVPSKPGMGLNDESMEVIHGIVSKQMEKGPLFETDISAWDWSVQGWMLTMEAEIRIEIAKVSHDSVYAQCLLKRARIVSMKVFALSNGKMISQTVPAIQASGSYNTSGGNSRMRVAVAVLLLVEWIIAMGDDAIETGVPSGDGELAYKRLGLPVKMYKQCLNGEFEFCSTRWSKDSPYGVPVGWPKTVYRYLTHKPNSALAEEWRVQLVSDLRHHPRGSEILRICDDLSWTGQNENGKQT